MNIVRKQTMIKEVLEYLYQNPRVLTGGNGENFSLKIVFSDKKKRYTEFYRLKLNDSLSGKATYYWIRIVKNKPDDIILKALEKQYGIMKHLFECFSNDKANKNVHFSCCKPVAILKELHTVITAECSGILFNKYLKLRSPLFSQKSILEHCYNCGLWLKSFHKCFKEDLQESNFNYILKKFQKKFKRSPHESMRFITYCHNDYSPRNIFVGKNFLEVIDFVGVEKGFPEEDLEFFRNYILKAKFNFLYPIKFRQKMVDEFLKGYESGK